MQQQQYTQQKLFHPAWLILASLVQGPKHAIALQEVIEQAERLYVEPGTLYHLLAQLEQRGWIEVLTIEQPLRLYQITVSGRLAFERAEAGRQRERFQEGGGLRKRKEFIMRPVLWILCLYPPAWRERYEAEMMALLLQHQVTLWTVLDLLVGALDARLDPHYRRARQLLPLRRFQSSWRLVVGGLVAFWIALLPWLWMSVLGIPDTECGEWGNGYGLCTMRVTVGMHVPSLAQTFVGTILGTIPLLLIAFLAVLVLARGRKARTHLLLILPVTIYMLVLCLVCAGWLTALWPLLPQINRFYPQATAELLAGLVGMGVATLLALGSLARAAFALKALKALSATAPKQESHPFSSNQQASEAAQGIDTPHLERPTVSASRSKASRIPRRWRVVLVVLLLMFAFPLPLLVPFDGSGILFWLVTCCVAGIVGLITALLVKSPSKKQATRATTTGPLFVEAVPKCWRLLCSSS